VTQQPACGGCAPLPEQCVCVCVCVCVCLCVCVCVCVCVWRVETTSVVSTRSKVCVRFSPLGSTSHLKCLSPSACGDAQHATHQASVSRGANRCGFHAARGKRKSVRGAENVPQHTDRHWPHNHDTAGAMTTTTALSDSTTSPHSIQPFNQRTHSIAASGHSWVDLQARHYGKPR
jgi:hypothetical protein